MEFVHYIHKWWQYLAFMAPTKFKLNKTCGISRAFTSIHGLTLFWISQFMLICIENDISLLPSFPQNVKTTCAIHIIPWCRSRLSAYRRADRLYTCPDVFIFMCMCVNGDATLNGFPQLKHDIHYCERHNQMIFCLYSKLFYSTFISVNPQASLYAKLHENVAVEQNSISHCRLWLLHSKIDYIFLLK